MIFKKNNFLGKMFIVTEYAALNVDLQVDKIFLSVANDRTSMLILSLSKDIYVCFSI